MLQYLVIFGAIAQLAGILYYVRDVLRGKAKPNKITWLMWTIAPMISTVAALSAGVRWVVLPVFMAGFGPLLVFVASFFNKKSYWKLNHFDYLCGFFSLLAIFLWGVTKDPLIAIFFSIVSDACAGLPTLLKSWSHPKTENAAPYAASIVSSFIAIFFAQKNWDFSEVAFPIYLITLNVLLVLIIKVFNRDKTISSDSTNTLR